MFSPKFSSTFMKRKSPDMSLVNIEKQKILVSSGKIYILFKLDYTYLVSKKITLNRA